MRSELAKSLKQKIHGCDPYEGYNWLDYPKDLTGGEIFPIIERVVESVRPSFIVEVGSWKGKSAVHFADLLIKYKIPDPTVLCIDTWLGSDPVHQWRFKNDPIWGMKNYYKHGFPTIYYQFLSNVCYAEYQDIIVPFPNTSSVGAEFLASEQLKADLIYIDGCHDEDECYFDIQHYWRLLKSTGVLCGDDFDVGWYGVVCAVNKFAREHDLTIYRGDKTSKWFLAKMELELI